MTAPIDIVEGEITDWRAALDRADLEIASLGIRLSSMTRLEELARYQLATARLAAMGNSAALLLRPGERGYSSALGDVVRLRLDWERLSNAARER